MKKNVWAILLIYTCSFFFVVWVKITVVKTGYLIHQKENQIRKNTLALSEIEYQLGQLTTRAQIAAQSKRLGLLLPGDYALDKIRYLNRESSVGAVGE